MNRPRDSLDNQEDESQEIEHDQEEEEQDPEDEDMSDVNERWSLPDHAATLPENDTAQKMRQLHQASQSDKIPYVKSGIVRLAFKMGHHQEASATTAQKWPLENIFKQLHATDDIPIVLFHPGKQRELIVRLYAPTASKNGKRIPKFTKKEIMRTINLMKSPANSINAYMSVGNRRVELFVSLNQRGHLSVRAESDEPLAPEKWNHTLREWLQKWIQDLNRVVLNAGYKLPDFDALEKLSILDTMTFLCSIPLESPIQNLRRQIPCITDIFDVYDDAEIRFKLTREYQDAAAQNHWIHWHQEHRRGMDKDAMVHSLMDHFRLDLDAANARYDAFVEDSPNLLEAGVPIRFSVANHQWTWVVDNLTSMVYLKDVRLFLDCVLLLTQPSLASWLPEDRSLVEAVCGDQETTPELRIKPSQDQDQEDDADDDVNDDVNDSDNEGSDYVQPKRRADEEANELFGYATDDDDEEDDEVSGGAKETKAAVAAAAASGKRYVIKRLQEYDPELFSDKHYARKCPANQDRQPMVLSEVEMAIAERDHAGSYTTALKQGSNYYVCPRYWCKKTRMPMTQEEVDRGTCGPPDGPDILVFDHPLQHRDASGNYIYQTPGLVKDSNMPCCFKTGKKDKAAAATAAAAPSKGDDSDVRYVKDHLSVPLPPQRWGFLSPALQQLFQIDYTNVKSGNAIAMEASCLLRYGVEKSETQSFLACMADIYAYANNPKKPLEQIPTIAEMRAKLADAITLDRFQAHHQGNLITLFAVSKGEDNDTRDRVTRAYEHFRQFITDPRAPIDHTYLWDAVTEDNPAFFPGGLNLVILSKTDHKDEVELICPTNATRPVYDFDGKQTVLLLKQGPYYEPIYYYRGTRAMLQITKGFRLGQFPEMTRTLKRLDEITREYCAAENSTAAYPFQRNRTATEWQRALASHREFKVTRQVVNERRQVVGLVVDQVVVPCAPSGLLPGLESIPLDDASLPASYRQTLETLEAVHRKTQFPALPHTNVLDDDGRVVAILTETNQWVAVTPGPLPPSELPHVANQASYRMADKMLMTDDEDEDPERIRVVRTISLEKTFYASFRIMARRQLHAPDHAHLKDHIRLLVEEPSGRRSHLEKLRACVALLHQLLDAHVRFDEVDWRAAQALDALISCHEQSAPNAFCFMRQGRRTLLLPKSNLVDPQLSNDAYYFGRLSDELLRNRRIRYFMMNPTTYFYSDNVQYSVLHDEVLLALSSIDDGSYFKNMVPLANNAYVTHNTHMTAQPLDLTIPYTNKVMWRG